MGYVSSGQQSLLLDGPVDLDKVTVVARDCVLAYVECQVCSITVQCCGGESKRHYCLVSLMWMKIGSNDITAQVPGVS
jgi:hypothetical protein